MRCRLSALLAPALALAPLGWLGPAGADELPAFLQRLEQASAATRTLTAEFVQAKQMTLFRTEVKTKGRLLYQRPDQLRWETFAPDPSLLLVRGQRAELRLPGEQPKVLDLIRGGVMAALVEQMLTWLGARPASQLASDYKIKIQHRDGWSLLQLEPRHAAMRKKIERLSLELDERLLLRQVAVKQAGGDKTVISFTEVQRNVALPPNSFR